MNKAPDGAVVDEVSSDEGTITPTGEPEREAGECGGPNPNPMGGAGAVGSAGARPRRTTLQNVLAGITLLKTSTP